MIFESIRNAKQIFFNSQKSGLDANNVQDAMDAMGNTYYYTVTEHPHSEGNENNVMTVYAYRTGNVVSVFLQCTAQMSTSQNELTEQLEECVLPVGFRPIQPQYAAAASVISGALQKEFTRWILNPNGTWRFSADNALVYCERSCNFAYITRDAVPDESYLHA